MFSYPKEPNKMMISSTTTSTSNSSSISNVEEFSFPVVSNNNNPLSNFMLTSSSLSSSSSLWRISSRVYHHPEDCYYEYREGVSYSNNNNNDNNYNVDDYRMEVSSMCEEIMPSRRDMERSASSVSFQSKDLEVQESMMDYLWEDFNEEEKKEFKGRNSTSEDMRFMEVNRIGRRRTSNSNSGTKMLLLGKFLKGLVSIRKSAQIKLSKSRF